MHKWLRRVVTEGPFWGRLLCPNPISAPSSVAGFAPARVPDGPVAPNRHMHQQPWHASTALDACSLPLQFQEFLHGEASVVTWPSCVWWGGWA